MILLATLDGTPGQVMYALLIQARWETVKQFPLQYLVCLRTPNERYLPGVPTPTRPYPRPIPDPPPVIPLWHCQQHRTCAQLDNSTTRYLDDSTCWLQLCLAVAWELQARGLPLPRRLFVDDLAIDADVRVIVIGI